METLYSVTGSSSKLAAIRNSGERISNVDPRTRSSQQFASFLVFLRIFGSNCQHLCVVASHKTHHRRVACHGPYCFFNLSSFLASRSRGNGASRLRFATLFFVFFKAGNFFSRSMSTPGETFPGNQTRSVRNPTCCYILNHPFYHRRIFLSPRSGLRVL